MRSFIFHREFVCASTSHKTSACCENQNSLMVHTEHRFHSLKGRSTQVLSGTINSAERLMCFTAVFTKQSFSAAKHSTSLLVCVCHFKSILSEHLHACMCPSDRTDVLLHARALICVGLFPTKCYSTAPCLRDPRRQDRQIDVKTEGDRKTLTQHVTWSGRWGETGRQR